METNQLAYRCKPLDLSMGSGDLSSFQFSAACLIRDLPVPALYRVLHIQEARLHPLGVRAPVDICPGTVTRYALYSTYDCRVFACHPIGSFDIHTLPRFLLSIQ